MSQLMTTWNDVTLRMLALMFPIRHSACRVSPLSIWQIRFQHLTELIHSCQWSKWFHGIWFKLNQIASIACWNNTVWMDDGCKIDKCISDAMNNWFRNDKCSESNSPNLYVCVCDKCKQSNFDLFFYWHRQLYCVLCSMRHNNAFKVLNKQNQNWSSRIPLVQTLSLCLFCVP